MSGRDTAGSGWPTVSGSAQTASNRSTKTIKRRIATLVAEQWLRPVSPNFFEHTSWEALRVTYNISHNKFYHITPTKHVQIEYILKAKVLLEKKEQCKIGYTFHLKRRPYDAEIIERVSGTLKGEAVAEHQLRNFITEGIVYDEEERGALSLRYAHRNETHLNGDTEFNFKTGTKIFGYQSWGGFAVMKRALVKRGVIVVESRRTRITRGTNTTLKKRKTRLGFVKYEKDLGDAFLIQPDKITVVPNVHIDAQFERMKATRMAVQAVFQKLAA